MHILNLEDTEILEQLLSKSLVCCQVGRISGPKKNIRKYLSKTKVRDLETPSNFDLEEKMFKPNSKGFKFVWCIYYLMSRVFLSYKLVSVVKLRIKLLLFQNMINIFSKSNISNKSRRNTISLKILTFYQVLHRFDCVYHPKSKRFVGIFFL